MQQESPQGLSTPNVLANDVPQDEGTNQSLLEREMLYRTLAESSPDMIFIIDPEDRVVYANTYAASTMGKKPEEIIGLRRSSLFEGEVDEVQRAHIRQVFMTGKANALESSIPTVHGQQWIHTQIVPLKDAAGNVFAVMGIARDLTERKMVEQALQEMNDRFRATFEQAAVGITHIDLNGAFLRANQRFCEIVGYTQKELLGLTYMEITHPDDLDYNYMEQLLAGEITSFAMDKRYIKKNGRPVWVHMTASLLRDDNGVPKFHIGVVQDISRRKKAEAALQKAKQTLEERVAERTSRLRSLTRQMVNAQELERKRIARELHDEVGQVLLGLNMSLGAILEQVPEDAPDVRQKMVSTIEQIADTVNGLRALSHRLRPAALEVGGLHLGLEQLCGNVSTQTALSICYEGQPLELSEEAALGLYRVAQEALTNAAKHARASRVDVKLSQKKSWVVLSVQDNGIKFTRGQAGDGLGLLGMEERLTSLGGRLMIQSNKNGTRLTAIIPIQSNQRS